VPVKVLIKPIDFLWFLASQVCCFFASLTVFV